MKKHTILLLATSILTLTICSCKPTPEPKPDDKKSEQIILDNTFQNGFSCEPANGSIPDTGWQPDNRWSRSVDLTYGDSMEEPSWLMAQHGDVYSLCDHYNKVAGEEPTFEDGYYTFKDESKQVSINPSKGALYLELNASSEYLRPRKHQEQWCHLLIQQGFTSPVTVGEVKDVIFTIDLERKKWVDHMGESANRDVHACQFLMYLVVKSNNSLDGGDFFWFGIPFFDNRYPHGLPESAMIDAGGAGATSKMIYQMPSADFLPNGTPVNEKVSINVDIKPYIGRALLKAREYDFFMNTTFDDLYFQAMNIGFEIPGTYDCGFEISNFSLTANYE